MMKDDGTFFREVEHDLWAAEPRMEYCDENNVDVQVLSTVTIAWIS